MHSGKEEYSAIEQNNSEMTNHITGKKTGAAAGKKDGATGHKRKASGAQKPRTANSKNRVIPIGDSEASGYNRAASVDIEPEDVVFALDIGTRTVVGVVGVQEDSCFRVIATEISEHKSRAMIDGQIHDIEQVAVVAQGVKEKLEKRLGFPLKKVAIAAAGRVLRTCQVRVDKTLEPDREIDAELISSLEIEGIQRAQMLLDEEGPAEDKTQFYCVGYSVINYYLNGYIISKLHGHKGKNAGADILATFLPLIVVDSLYSVMSRIGLEVSSLTLEPIAAINVTIPQDLRLLNLALVDIGAGTSDIALTKDGSVIAYAMVPQAGDEITEQICQHYLVDFNTGEKIKIALSSKKEKITFTDILKIKHTVTWTQVMDVIADTMELLASTIAQRILEYNHKAPNAVFLVGGGSRINGFAEMLARQIGLPTERVVVRGRDVIRNIRFDDKKLYGPESITPYGIAITAQIYRGKDFLTVTVNDKKVKLFNSKKLTVADALILFGFDAGQLIGRSGKGIRFFVNGEIRTVRGEHGRAAEIYVNKKLSGLDTPIAYGDTVDVIPAVDGKDAFVTAGDVVTEYRTGKVRLNGNPVDISTVIHINDKQASMDTPIHDDDQIRLSCIETLGGLLEAAGLEADRCTVQVNGAADYQLSHVLQDGDIIICTELKEEKAEKTAPVPGHTSSDASASDAPANGMSGPLQGDVENVSADSPSIPVNVNGKQIILKSGKSQPIFVDIFNYIDFDLTKPQGNIVLKLNGHQASFTDAIRSGDAIEIYWNK